MITKENAVHQARMDGLRTEQITDEVLKLYGYVVPNPTVGIPTTPYMTNPDVVAALGLLKKEEEENHAALNEDVWKAIGLVTGVVKQVVKI